MDENFTEKLSTEAIMYLTHHIFLPPRLPQEDDSDLEYESIMLNVTLDALRKFKTHVVDENDGAIDLVIAMISSLMTIRASVGERELESALRELCKKGTVYVFFIMAFQISY
ncbi:hypothetical protein M501DRAFT_998922 [Patellaria atrata CBS 101060]|uniref:DUF6606 domain-containing protein n=1 Tax=Patellaria atrata CBS 101060 TaxID=1346257 RepID=A0A9P4S477_9PEZI|nr:hypothetical protein M501DRAFT_998922 [Patellaria atrata CBS 101060]